MSDGKKKKKNPDLEFICTAFAAKESPSSAWIFGTGVSAHMTGCHSNFSTFIPLSIQSGSKADKTLVPVTGKENIKLYFRNRQNEFSIHYCKMSC